MVCDKVSVPIDGASDRNCLKTNLLFFDENWSRLRCIPNFWFDLIRTKHRLIHIVDVLLVVIGLYKSREAHQSTLLLSANLAVGHIDVNSEYALLYTLFFV